MPAHGSILSWVGPLLGVMMAALPLQATSNLLENSPFLPGNVAPGAGQDSAPLELRSILKEGGDYEFSLYDVTKKQSTWAGLNESGHDFTIKAFDPDKEVVTVEHKNRTYKLTLKEAKIALLAVAPGQAQARAGMPANGAPGEGGVMPPGVSPPGGPFPMGVRGPNGTAPSLTPEQLRNLEADINRRRELRRQAAAAQSAGSAPAQPRSQP
jgi:hypothetical protein